MAGESEGSYSRPLLPSFVLNDLKSLHLAAFPSVTVFRNSLSHPRLALEEHASPILCVSSPFDRFHVSRRRLRGSSPVRVLIVGRVCSVGTALATEARGQGEQVHPGDPAEPLSMAYVGVLFVGEPLAGCRRIAAREELRQHVVTGPAYVHNIISTPLQVKVLL